MAFDWAGAGTALSGVANLAGVGYSIFGGSSGASTPPQQGGFKSRIATPGYTFGSGQLTRLSPQVDRYGRQIKRNLAGTREGIVPGYGRLTQAVTDQIRSQGAQAVGNLRSSLAQRGLTGASFANDAIARVEAEYSQQEATARAQAFESELQATSTLIGQEMQLQGSMLERDLTELGIATQFLSGVKQIQEKQSMMLSDLAQRRAKQIMKQQLG